MNEKVSRRSILALGAVAAAELCTQKLVAAETPFAFRELGGTGLELSDGGKPVFVYNYGMILARGAAEACGGPRISTPSMPRTAAPC